MPAQEDRRSQGTASSTPTALRRRHGHTRRVVAPGEPHPEAPPDARSDLAGPGRRSPGRLTSAVSPRASTPRSMAAVVVAVSSSDCCFFIQSHHRRPSRCRASCPAPSHTATRSRTCRCRCRGHRCRVHVLLHVPKRRARLSLAPAPSWRRSRQVGNRTKGTERRRACTRRAATCSWPPLSSDVTGGLRGGPAHKHAPNDPASPAAGGAQICAGRGRSRRERPASEGTRVGAPVRRCGATGARTPRP